MDRKSKRELISLATLTALVGFVLSGPVGFLMVELLWPQPAWTTAGNFVAHYHAFQNLPYFFGFILVGGMLMLAAAHYRNISHESELDKMHMLLSLVWTILFSVLVFFNYICQTTFVHHLVTHYNPGYNSTIEMLSMTNPSSLSWCLEMWGYAFLGIATWLLSSYYREKNKLIYSLLIVNGVVSILSAVLFIIDNGWLLSGIGIGSYFSWNMLMIVLLILIYNYSKSHRHAKQGS